MNREWREEVLAKLKAEHQRLLGYLDLQRTNSWREVVSSRELESEMVSVCIQDGMSIPAAVAVKQKWFEGTSDAEPRTIRETSFQSLLMNHQAEVEAGILSTGVSLERPVFVGDYPLGHLSCEARRVGEGYLVLMDSALMMGLHRSAKVFVWGNQFLSTSDSPLEGAAIVWSRRRAVQTLATMCSCYFLGDINQAPRDQVPPGIRLWMAVEMVASAERLVLAHEYAHILNGDVDQEPLSRDADDETKERYAESRRAAEIEADLIAFTFELAEKDWSGNDEYGRNKVRAVLAGGALFFGLANLLRVVGREVYEAPRYDDKYHPEPFKRADAVRTSLMRRLDGELLEFWDWCVQWWQGCAEEVVEASRTIYVAALARRRRLPEANCLEDSAQTFCDQQEYAAAVPLLRRVIEIRGEALGDCDLTIAVPLNNLANCLSRLGKEDESGQLLGRALAILERGGGLNEKFLANILYNLAAHHALLSEHEKAEPLFQRCLTVAELADNHRSFADCVHTYLLMLTELERYGQVEALCKHSVAVTRQTLGAEHPEFWFNLSRLASLYENQNRYSEAVPLQEELVDISRRVLGEQHPEFATALNNLAFVYMHVGRFEDAEPLFILALQITRSALGVEHPAFATSLNNLGLLYEATNRENEAERAFQQAADIMTAAVGANHPNAEKSLGNLNRVVKRIATTD